MKTVNPKVSIYLFSQDNPTGEIFKFVGGKESDEFKAMLENGYYESPAQLDLPEKEIELTTEQVQAMRPEDLKAMLESYGFIVMTPEQLKAEVNKLVDTHIDIKDFSDEAIIAEAERRGLKEGDSSNDDELPDLESEDKEPDGTEGLINTTDFSAEQLKEVSKSNEPSKIETLLTEFSEEPESLNKDELVFLGNEKFKLGLRSNMLESTLIAKINEALNAE